MTRKKGLQQKYHKKQKAVALEGKYGTRRTYAVVTTLVIAESLLVLALGENGQRNTQPEMTLNAFALVYCASIPVTKV